MSNYPKIRMFRGFMVRQAQDERIGSVRPEPVEGHD
jgi:hypothetical protein